MRASVDVTVANAGADADQYDNSVDGLFAL
jgi:hypothetical protein